LEPEDNDTVNTIRVLSKKLSTSIEQAVRLRRLTAVLLDLAGGWQERKGLERKAHSGGELG